jgi:hypothetical protein
MGVESLCCQVTILDKRVEEGVKRGEEAGAANSITTSPDEETFKAGSTNYAHCISLVFRVKSWMRIGSPNSVRIHDL